jgi:hypothetical protein
MQCGSTERVELMARTPGGAVAVFWHCRRCDQFWPTKLQEPQEEERRSGSAATERYFGADQRKSVGP